MADVSGSKVAGSGDGRGKSKPKQSIALRKVSCGSCLVKTSAWLSWDLQYVTDIMFLSTNLHTLCSFTSKCLDVEWVDCPFTMEMVAVESE